MMSPMKYYADIQPTTIIRALQEKDEPTIISIIYSTDKHFVKAILVKALGEVVNAVNIQRNLTDEQRNSVCDLIISKYYYWALVELKTCLRNAITHGEIYNRIDYSVVAHWLAEYDIERSNVTSEIEANTNNEYKHKINGNATFNKFLSELRQKADNGDEYAQRRLHYWLSIQATSRFKERNKGVPDGWKKNKNRKEIEDEERIARQQRKDRGRY